MAGIISVIIILAFSIIITRIASIALTHTGLSREASRFQARSAFTGVGFTTSESEKAVNHPVRRRILQLLMILGNAGIVTGVASLIIGFSGIGNNIGGWLRILILVFGIALLWGFANSQWADKRLSYVIDKILKRYTKLDVNDYASLLHLSGEFRISEISIYKDHWLADKKLKNSKLRDEGLNVIAISRSDGTFIGNPNGETKIRKRDSVIVYGRAKTLNRIDKRYKGLRGNFDHNKMVKEQKEVLAHEKEDDKNKEKTSD
jgi:NhaP-type Na+/H+ and K+/H+ antiporter